MSEKHHLGDDKYALKEAMGIPHHDPSEGFDPTEPHARRIVLFVVLSVGTLIATILALQFYFDKYWEEMVYERVLSVPPGELRQQRNLEDWRLTHYEYADAERKRVRLPLDRARELFLKEEAEGKTFYPARPTEPKPETPPGAQAAAGATVVDGKEAQAK